MTMDMTVIFKSVVRLKKDQLKTAGIDVHDDILKTRKRCEYIRKFKDLVSQITQLRDFLMQHRNAYMNLSPFSSEMNDFDRDKVDDEAQCIIKICSQLISTYKKETHLIDEKTQELENREAIIDLIESYLKNVCKIYTEQKAIRVKLTVESQKLSKLTQASDMNLLNNTAKENGVDNKNKANESNNEANESKNNKMPDRLRYSTFAAVNETEENVLSEEELQMFEMENEQLYNELNSLNDEVRDIQSKVIKIAELQEVFTEKVLEQNDEIERISTTLVGTTENLKDANVQIRQAIQSNASLRIYILFFLLVMSFSLLFLDWYND